GPGGHPGPDHGDLRRNRPERSAGGPDLLGLAHPRRRQRHPHHRRHRRRQREGLLLVHGPLPEQRIERHRHEWAVRHRQVSVRRATPSSPDGGTGGRVLWWTPGPPPRFRRTMRYAALLLALLATAAGAQPGVHPAHRALLRLGPGAGNGGGAPLTGRSVSAEYPCYDAHCRCGGDVAGSRLDGAFDYEVLPTHTPYVRP